MIYWSRVIPNRKIHDDKILQSFKSPDSMKISKSRILIETHHAISRRHPLMFRVTPLFQIAL